MQKRSRSLAIVILAAVLPPTLRAQTQGRSQPGPAPAAERGPARVPGAPLRWIVRLKVAGVDLFPLRQAILDRRPIAERRQLLEAVMAESARLQASVVADVTGLGARVREGFWIVPALAVEASTEQAGRIAALPSVGAVEPDLLVPACGDGFLNDYNHGVGKLHKAGYDGSNATLPAIVAIMDSGIDRNMNGTGRPHRAFFPGGDPKNTTGGGLSGSRLVLSRQIGALSDDDPHGHGTRAAGVAAAADWGRPTSTDGHARGAQIANYAIGDYISGNIFSYYSTMTSAWQAILADRTASTNAANIVAANNSFGGPQDPLHTTQQALDTCAFIGDVLITISAGNNGPGAYTGKQSACNGLAVGALVEDWLQVVNWSSRGPVVGDPTRTYPDIAALTWSQSPTRDCETDVWTFSGTSNAAPHVAGCATLVRAAVPGLRADETKAILLASARDISARNPNLGPNDFGQGMLRDDLALATAQDAKAHAVGALTTTTSTWKLPIPVQQGGSYTAALAWMRLDTSSTAWSDLELQVWNGTTMVSSANSPRNLYERAPFKASSTGSYELRVLARSLPGNLPASGQPFAVAVARHPDAWPSGGISDNWEEGCDGSGADNGPVIFAWNPQVEKRWTEGWISEPERFAARLQAPANQDLVVQGIELFASALVANSTEVGLWADNGGLPAATPLATAMMPISLGEGWHRVRLTSPVTIPKGTAFHFSVKVGHKTWITVSPDVQNDPSPPWSSWDQCSSGWQSRSYQLHIAMRLDGPTIGTGARPRVAFTGRPQLGQSFGIELHDARGSTAAVLLTGTSNQTWGPIPLPLDLVVLGSGGCHLRSSVELISPLAVDAQGRGSLLFPLPDILAFQGLDFFQQFVILDPPANGGGLVTSRGVYHHLGRD